MLKTLLAIIFTAGNKASKNKQIDKKIAEMRKQGRGIWINGKFVKMG